MGKKGFYMNNELIEKIKNAKTAEEVIEIARKELSFEDTANVAGGTGRFELSEAQAEHVAGGGHYYMDSTGHTLYVSLLEEGYVQGTDPWLDKACILEVLADAGYPVVHIVGFACEIFPGTRVDIEQALKIGGTAYLAECARSAHGYHFSPGN